MNDCLVSVIIPTYNRVVMLQRALDSVTKQDYTNLEIIVVDDGSNDNTEQVVKRDNDKRIKYYRKKNSGTADSRNYGLKKAKGKYICLCNAATFLNRFKPCGL